jgi:phage gp45-like
MELWDNIIKSNTPDGRILGLSLGVVASTDDPLGIQRLQVYDNAKGGKYLSDWLFRALPYTSYSPPVPKLGDLVIIGYINGDPHKGCYLGVVVNQKNKPVGSNNDLTIVLGTTTIKLSASGDISIDGAANINITNSSNVVVNSTNITINGSQKVEMNAPDIKLKATSGITLEAPSLALKTPLVDTNSIGTFSLGGQRVAVVGATDSRGDTIVSPGW